MKIRTITCATVISVSLMAPFAFAGSDSADSSADPMAGDMESSRPQAPAFEVLDANADGVISVDELNVYGATAAGQPEAADPADLEMRDMNGDGNITREEFDEGAMSWD